jgi:4-amino-4-deoxy-L-arabinose transferase-like glycosyltransferase
VLLSLPTLFLALLAAVLPPQALAAALTGAAAPQVVMGLWILKGALLVLAGFLALTRRLDLKATGGLLTPRPEEAAPAWATGAMLALLVLGAGLRLHRLGEGLWFDEIQTLVDYVRLPLGRIVTTFDSQNQHLLYSISARLAVVALGESATALRLPAVIFGTVSLWAIYRFGRELSGGRTGLLAAALLTLSYHHVWFSQNARGYTGLLLWTLLGSLAFLRLLRDPNAGWGWILAYGVTMALGAYTHITSAFTSAAHALLLVGLAWSARHRAPKGWIRPALGLAASGLIGLVLYAPVLPQFVATLLKPGPHAAATAWQNPLWLAAETLRGLAAGLPGGWFGLAAGVVVVGAGLWSFWREERSVVALLVLPALFTGAAMAAISHNLWPRFFFFSAGFAALIAVQGGFALSRLVLRERGEWAATAAVLLVAVGSGLTVPRAWGPKQDYQRAAAFVASHRAPGDAVVTVDLTIFPYERYAECPCAAVQGLDSLEAVEQTHPRTWVLTTFPIRLASVEPAIWDRLQTQYDTAAIYPGTVGGGAIVVMVRRALPPAT